jgi:hypothetical protein
MTVRRKPEEPQEFPKTSTEGKRDRDYRPGTTGPPAENAGKEAAMTVLDRRVRIFQAPVLLALALVAGGCASVFHGTRQKVEVFTDPPGATATAGGESVTTPGVLKLPRKGKNTEIRIEKEGFAAKTIRLERLTSGLVWLNFIGIPAGVFGGAYAGLGSNDNGWFGNLENAGKGAVIGGVSFPGLGFLADFQSGAAYRLDPARVVVRLDPVVSAASDQVP